MRGEGVSGRGGGKKGGVEGEGERVRRESVSGGGG